MRSILPPSNDGPEGAVPKRVDNLRGLPPAFIGVGSIDLFVRKNAEYARRLNDAGVCTEFYIAPGGYHGFDAAVRMRAFRDDFKTRGTAHFQGHSNARFKRWLSSNDVIG